MAFFRCVPQKKETIVNLFDKDSSGNVLNARLGTSGTIACEGSFVSHFIPVTGGKTYRIKWTRNYFDGTYKFNRYGFYRSKSLSTATNIENASAADEFDVLINSNASYLVIACSMSGIDSTLVYEVES